MKKNIILYIFTGIIVSFYFFPFIFKAIPFFNTKNILALIGGGFFFFEFLKYNKGKIYNKDYITIIMVALFVSLIGLISVTYNETQDYTYAKYIISMIVWLLAAFATTCTIKYAHGEISVILVCNYLISICVFQCIIALLIDSYPTIKTFVDSHIEQGQEFLNDSRVNRLYGIGANLDVAGSRFAATLVMLSILMRRIHNTIYEKYLPYYIIAFVIIAVAGNMIARTTTIGLVIGILYLIACLIKGTFHNINTQDLQLWKWLIGIFTISIVTLSFLYNTDIETKRLLRFAFEGFFNLIERGEFSTASSDRLFKVMYVFPDNLKTWIIGDGYFNNPKYDPYYTGKLTGGYYMGTDAGYLRFIFYFGLTGLFAFIFFLYKTSATCIHKFPKYKNMFLMLLCTNFIVWFKVSTDIFLVFALFLCINKDDNEEYEQKIVLLDKINT